MHQNCPIQRHIFQNLSAEDKKSVTEPYNFLNVNKPVKKRCSMEMTSKISESEATIDQKSQEEGKEQEETELPPSKLGTKE